jgi:hypothetical protein
MYQNNIENVAQNPKSVASRLFQWKLSLTQRRSSSSCIANYPHTCIYFPAGSFFKKIQRNRFHYGHRVFCHLVSSPILYTHSCIREAGNMSIAFLSACLTRFARSSFCHIIMFLPMRQIVFLLTIDCLYWAMKA